MREVDQAALSVPDVLSSHYHGIAQSDGNPPADTDIVLDQDGLTGGATNDEALVVVPAVGVGEQPGDMSCDDEPGSRGVILEGGGGPGAIGGSLSSSLLLQNSVVSQTEVDDASDEGKGGQDRQAAGQLQMTSGRTKSLPGRESVRLRPAIQGITLNVAKDLAVVFAFQSWNVTTACLEYVLMVSAGILNSLVQ